MPVSTMEGTTDTNGVQENSQNDMQANQIQQQQPNNKYSGFMNHLEGMVSATKRLLTPNKPRYRLNVVTGDRLGAGTDANIYVVLYDALGNASEVIRPKTIFSNDHERGETTSVLLTDSIKIFPPFSCAEVWRDNFGNVPSFLGKLSSSFFGSSEEGVHGSAAWYLDRIEVEILEFQETNPENKQRRVSTANNVDTPDNSTMSHVHSSPNSNIQSSERNLKDITQPHSEIQDFENGLKPHNLLQKYIFPFQRWIAGNRKYKVNLYDSVLPQDDTRPISRLEELDGRKNCYRYKQIIEGGPQQIAELPTDEKFSDHYYWSFVGDKLKLVAKTKFIDLTTKQWTSLAEIKEVCRKGIGEPACMDRWDTDEWFGLQRLQGVNPLIIELCTTIPDKLDVSADTVSNLIEGQTLQEALDQKRIFICDLEILDKLGCKNERELAAPLALFHLRENDHLMPIAIQLKQQKGPLNPVYTPNDDAYTWLVAKMFYNNAEAQHHQGLSHLGLTHLLMEGVCICTHRNLSPSHPLFKLMAPHFLFLLAINSRGLEKLISPGGWVDKCMTQGISGIYELIKRGHDRYVFTTWGNVENEISRRGVTKDVLPYYPYRDDAIPLFKIIRDYVSEVVNHYYDTTEKLLQDIEVLQWRQELGRPKEQKGLGLKGVPGCNVNGFDSIDQLVETVCIIISTSSLGHAASNFQQYEQYAFIPNYPGILNIPPPTSKCTYTEKEILEILPDKSETLEIMLITRLLSKQGTNAIGDFEIQYLYDPRDVAAAEKFRKELKILSLEIKKQNLNRQYAFSWLDPEIVPNAISI